MTTSKYELPAGVGGLAGLITTGTSIFGWEPDRDGIPEVVTRAHERIGSEGCVAIVRLARSLDPVPKFAAAERLAEWGITHYRDRQVCSGGLQPEWQARAELMQRHYAEGVAQSTRELGWGVPWADCIDWLTAAEKAVGTGAVIFTEHITKRQGIAEAEVDLFICDGTGWEEDDEAP